MTTLSEKISTALSVIREAYAEHDRVTVANSFGKDSMVALHLVCRAVDEPDVFSVLSNTEFDETLALRDEVRETYDLDYREFTFEQPDGAADDVARCCGEPKVEATARALDGYDAWITGLRETESETRRDARFIEDEKETTKVNPIKEFTELDVWRYTAIHRIPVNEAYKQGYRSLGCANCTTLPESQSESERAGRWRNSSQTECGIHTTSL